MSAVEVISATGGLEVYSPFRARVAEIIEANKSMVFDYSTVKGQQEARSYVHTLRLSKKPIEDCRVQAKAKSLEYGRKVDAEGKQLIGLLDDMIEHHMRPIREAEEREAARIADITAQMDYLRTLTGHAAMPPDELRSLMTKLHAVLVDEAFGEFQDEAKAFKAEQLAALSRALTDSEQRIARDAELEKLREEAAARERQDRERQIADEAASAAKAKAEADAERARLEVERRAQAEKDAAEARERAERERAERAEAEVKEARERADRAAQDAVENERKEAADKAAREQAEQAAREADIEHKRAINNEVLADLMEHAGVSEQTAKMVIVALFSGRVRNIKISY